MTVVRSQFFKFRSMAVLFNFLLLFAKQIGVKGLNDPITETNKLPFAPKYDLRVCAIQVLKRNLEIYTFLLFLSYYTRSFPLSILHCLLKRKRATALSNTTESWRTFSSSSLRL